jgi:hypothetical protein
VARRRPPIAAVAIVALLIVAATVFVISSLDRPEPPTRAPDPVRPLMLGDSLVGPTVTTVDASGERAWTHFDFSRSSVVDRDDPLGWDLAFRRHRIIANGGAGFAGLGGILDLGEVPFDAVTELPAEGYTMNRVGGDTLNPAIEKWYDYGFTSHLLTPKPRTYALRTADGRYAKLAIVSYYCPGARPGCFTFRWVWQGDGTRRVGAG